MYKYIDQLEEGKRKLFENNNPYEVGERIWEVIKDNFNKYKVVVTQSFPTAPVTQNTISWRIQSRTPGTGEDNQHQSRGAQPTSWLGTTADGIYLSELTQTMQIDLQFGVFGSSSSEVNKIAWDLEQAVINSKYELQKDDSQIQVVFQRRSAQDTFQMRNLDDLSTQFITFRVVLPIRYIDAKPEIRKIQLAFRDGLRLTSKTQNRSSSTETFSISHNGLPLEAITQVSIYKNSNWIKLTKKVDYTLTRKEKSTEIILTWVTSGLNPAIGETFKVEYTYYSNNMHVILDDKEEG
jgi:hypothetical protein